MRGVVSSYFSDSRYAQVRKEVYPSFVNVFYQYLLTVKPDTLRGIQGSLDEYFYTAARHFLKPDTKYRKKIDASLGFDDTHVKLRPNVPDGENIGVDEDVEYDASASDEADFKDDSVEKEYDLDGKAKAGQDDWTAFMLHPYIQSLPFSGERRNRILADLGFKILDDLSSKEYAAKIGSNVADVDVRRRRAMLELIKVALPDIRKRAKKMFVRFKDKLSSSQASILQDFFDNGVLGDSKRRDAIAKAYKTLVIKANSEHRQNTQRYDEALKRQREKEGKPSRTNKNDIV